MSLGTSEKLKAPIQHSKLTRNQTYGIPSLSKLLVSTGQLSSKESPIDLRRYVETVLLIKEFSTYPPHDERVIKAIARINYMHRRHFKSGMLLNEDMLYTLRQFITMPFEYVLLLPFPYLAINH